jgi:hypothetical protein
LLLSTSNRSEAAVGYATMDGDTSGGLAPIAGIDKAYLRRWLRWMESEGPAGIGPLPALACSNRRTPGASPLWAERESVVDRSARLVSRGLLPPASTRFTLVLRFCNTDPISA